MKDPTIGKEMISGTGRQSRMDANIVDTMLVYFKNDKGKMGELELSIIDSVKRYFVEPPPPKSA